MAKNIMNSSSNTKVSSEILLKTQPLCVYPISLPEGGILDKPNPHVCGQDENKNKQAPKGKERFLISS